MDWEVRAGEFALLALAEIASVLFHADSNGPATGAKRLQGYQTLNYSLTDDCINNIATFICRGWLLLDLSSWRRRSFRRRRHLHHGKNVREMSFVAPAFKAMA